jgi:ankyrin repeat protein
MSDFLKLCKDLAKMETSKYIEFFEKVLDKYNRYTGPGEIINHFVDYSDAIDQLFKIHGIKLNNNLNFLLSEATKKRHLEIVKYLVKKGAVIKGSHVGLAIKYNCPDIFDFFIKKGVRLNLAEALEVASSENSLSIVRRIIGMNSDVEKEPSLALAINGGYFDIVECLIQNGSRITTMHVKTAINKKDPIITSYVLNRVNYELISVDEMLDYSCSYGNFDAVKILAEQNATTISKAIHVAEKNGYMDIARYLKFKDKRINFLFDL